MDFYALLIQMTKNKIQTERDQALASKKSAEDRLSWKEKEFTDLQTKYDDLINQLNAPDSALGEYHVVKHLKMETFRCCS